MSLARFAAPTAVAAFLGLTLGCSKDNEGPEFNDASSGGAMAGGAAGASGTGPGLGGTAGSSTGGSDSGGTAGQSTNTGGRGGIGAAAGSGGRSGGGSSGSSTSAGSGGASGAGGATSCFGGLDPTDINQLAATTCDRAWEACAARDIFDFDLCGCVAGVRAHHARCAQPALDYFGCMAQRSVADYECTFVNVTGKEDVCLAEWNALDSC